MYLHPPLPLRLTPLPQTCLRAGVGWGWGTQALPYLCSHLWAGPRRLSSCWAQERLPKVPAHLKLRTLSPVTPENGWWDKAPRALVFSWGWGWAVPGALTVAAALGRQRKRRYRKCRGATWARLWAQVRDTARQQPQRFRRPQSPDSDCCEPGEGWDVSPEDMCSLGCWSLLWGGLGMLGNAEV